MQFVKPFNDTVVVDATPALEKVSELSYKCT